jgi:predicted transcriptional regulator
MDKDICTLLKEIKVESGWSETHIAREIGTSQPTVNRILNGQLDCQGSTLLSIVNVHKRICIASVAKVNAASKKRRSTDKQE